MYDYQGFGRSQGSATVEGTCEDAVAAYDYLIQHEKRTAKDIIAVGESWGSGVTGQLVMQREVAGVIMHSGFASLVSAGRHRFFWLRLYPDWSFPKNLRLDNMAVFSKPHPPLLIVHGKTDIVIPCQEAKLLFERATEPKTLFLLPLGHCTFGKGNEFSVVVRRFLQENHL